MRVPLKVDHGGGVHGFATECDPTELRSTVAELMTSAEKHFSRTIGAMVVGSAKREHEDHRRRGHFDVFPENVVEVNVAVIREDASAGSWHVHARQADYWFVASGSLRVGVKDPVAGTKRTWVMWPGDLLHIPAGLLHTYRASAPTVLVYGLTNKWDGTDEGRVPYDENEGAEFL